MKNKAGKITGFILGTAGFLFIFKLLFLQHVPPEDELAPGIVLMTALLVGLLFSFIGSITQSVLVKKEIIR